MNKAEHYLRKAEDCRKKANAETNAASAEMWLKMAVSYEDLARGFFIYSRLPGVEAAE
jgi:hypothetical protein